MTGVQTCALPIWIYFHFRAEAVKVIRPQREIFLLREQVGKVVELLARQARVQVIAGIVVYRRVGVVVSCGIDRKSVV